MLFFLKTFDIFKNKNLINSRSLTHKHDLITKEKEKQNSKLIRLEDLKFEKSLELLFIVLYFVLNFL